MFLRAFERKDGWSLLISSIGFMPLLKHNEVPEHPEGVGSALPMTEDKIINDVEIKETLVTEFVLRMD